MMSFASRALAALIVTLATALVQAEPGDERLAPDGLTREFRAVEGHIQAGRLEQAEQQLQALAGQAIVGDTRLEQYRRALLAAQVERGLSALAQDDLDTATQALAHARRLSPSAPTVTLDLERSLEQRLEAQRQAGERARAEAVATAAAVAARQAEQARQAAQRAEAQRQAVLQAEAAARAAARLAASVPAEPQAQLIDPQARRSQVDMPMLDTRDRDAARVLLEQVAADVVAFRCRVDIQVRESRDYPWVAAVLSARVKKLDPDFDLQLAQRLAPDQVPTLALSPQP